MKLSIPSDSCLAIAILATVYVRYFWPTDDRMQLCLGVEILTILSYHCSLPCIFASLPKRPFLLNIATKKTTLNLQTCMEQKHRNGDFHHLRAGIRSLSAHLASESVDLNSN